MAGTFEDVGKEMFDKLPGTAMKGAKITKDTVKETLYIGAKIGGKTIKGICLILDKGTEFTTHNVMKAVRNLAYNKTGNIEFSNQNVDMVKLQESGKVSKIEENITADVMKHFNEQCKRFGVKYSAMKDERDPANPSYMIFYNGKSAEIILQVMKEAYKDYIEAQKQTEKTNKEQEKGKEKKKGFWSRQHKEKPEKRESVIAKLAFFRDRVANREKDRDVLEKNVRHADLQR
ncbi:MAG: PcfB family protein [Lachnospiraceae bacterium]|nr:PcfB family protein [Lachnospiraceae bacterium]